MSERLRMSKKSSNFASKIVLCMEYNFSDIEKKWQKAWADADAYKVSNESDKPHYYVLDMFPYPSGAGLHVGHPLGYIASDIYSRYKRQKGFNVLHPMGFDSYGLPAEQYAIQTGQHPEKTTFENIDRYISQLKKIGFCYDWSREIRTCDPKYYHWTQWAFVQMFNSYFDPKTQKAQPISKLIAEWEANDPKWATLSEKEQQERLMNYRIAYLADTKVNWCPALGTVLANDEVSEGLSVRGGFPVEQRVMRQWCLRVSAYAGRLLEGLDRLDWTDSLKETQRNWIGRSEGAEMQFALKGQDTTFTIFTTRADTVFGVTFMVLAPESEYVAKVVTPEHKEEVDAYLARCKNRTERERIADRKVTGVFTGSYAINPLTQGEIPIYISDYVLAGYGTGAIMAVPAHDSRDYAFARHFNLPIIPLIEGADVSEQSFDAKEGIMMNSGTTVCATRSSPVSAIGASHSPSTTRTACPTRSMSKTYRSHCPRYRTSNRLRTVVLRWVTPKTGRTRVIRWSSVRCRALPVRVLTTSVTWIRITTRRSSPNKPMTTGARWTSISAVRSTQRDTSSTAVSGTSSSTTSVMYARTNRSRN